MGKPKIKAKCAAGCEWETIHREEFEELKARVTALGFKVGSISLVDANNGTQYGTATLKRQGNYVIVSGSINHQQYTLGTLYYGGVLGTLPEEFRPAEDITIKIGVLACTSSSTINKCHGSCELTIKTDGTITIGRAIYNENSLCTPNSFSFQTGYEAEPIVNNPDLPPAGDNDVGSDKKDEDDDDEFFP